MTSDIKNKLRDKLKSWESSKTPEDLIKEDEYILMANYLSEIERVKSKLGFTRKSLAKEINTSASYLTQVFRGDKPLNFYTLAKIQKALGIRFQVNVKYNYENYYPLEKVNILPSIMPFKNSHTTTKSENYDTHSLNSLTAFDLT